MKRFISTAIILLISSFLVVLGIKKARPAGSKPETRLFV